jgi:putative zinc finger/helix-turn-helix YgiT family protein
MISPFTGKEMVVNREWRKMTFRKEEFDVLFHTFKCEESGEKFEDEKFAQLNYNQLMNQYREKNSIPFPEEFKEIREKYGLPAVKMSEILGFGPNTYRQYEAGEVPSLSNAKLIQLSSDPHEFRKLVELCSSIVDKSKEKIKKQIEELIYLRKTKKIENELEVYFVGNKLPSSLTGYRKPNFQKFEEMVVFFAGKLEPWKTKLNKLLFYSDFLHYKRTGFSISGIHYTAIDLGPVPNNFNSIFELLAKKDVVDIYSKVFTDGIGEQFKPNPDRKLNQENFTVDELETLENVAGKFKNMSTKEIIDYSHLEKGWLENKEGKNIIDYSYAFDLNNE